jgi:hypothetical protein
MTTDTFLFNAGWFFLSAWIAVIAAVSIIAFGRDLLPARARQDTPIKIRKTDS